MPRIGFRTLVGAGLALATAGSVSAQTSPFTACRVPGVNVIYMIDFGPGSPTACLDAAHVRFTWTEGGGTPGPGSVTTAMLADGAVTTAKIADGTVAAGDHAAGSVNSAAIADGTVAATDVADGAITQAKLAASVTFPLADGAITGAKLANGAVTREKIAAAAVPNWKAAPYSSIPSQTTGELSTMATIAFNAPAPGSVWLQSSGYCNVPNGPHQGALVWGATATERFNVAYGNGSFTGTSSGSGTYWLPYAVSRTLAAPAGANTYYLSFDNLGGGRFECYGTNVLLYTPAQLP